MEITQLLEQRMIITWIIGIAFICFYCSLILWAYKIRQHHYRLNGVTSKEFRYNLGHKIDTPDTIRIFTRTKNIPLKTNKSIAGTHYVDAEAIVVFLGPFNELFATHQGSGPETVFCEMISEVIEHETIHKCLSEFGVDSTTHHKGMILAGLY